MSSGDGELVYIPFMKVPKAIYRVDRVLGCVFLQCATGVELDRTLAFVRYMRYKNINAREYDDNNEHHIGAPSFYIHPSLLLQKSKLIKRSLAILL